MPTTTFSYFERAALHGTAIHRSIRVGLLLLLVALVQGCATNPVTGSRQLALSEKWEASVGPQYHQQIMTQYQIYDDPDLQAYVNDIGQRLAAKSHRPDLQFTFTLLDSPQVNAFAIPGGFVYVLSLIHI